MQKTFNYSFRILNLSWKANGSYAILSIFNRTYEEGLYPLIQVLLFAKLLDILNAKGQFQNILWLAAAYISASFLKIILTSYLDVKQAYLDLKFESYLDSLITKKLSELDPATFEDPAFQDLFAQMNGIKGSMQAHIVKVTYLISAFVTFLAATIVVSFISFWFPLLILLATIPSFIILDKYRDATFSYYSEKRSFLVRLTEYVKSLMSSDSTSKEAMIFRTGPILLHKVKKEQKAYYKIFDKAISPWTRRIVLARILQFSVFLFAQYFTILKVFTGLLSIGRFILFFQQSLALTFRSEEILNEYSSISMRNKFFEKYYTFMALEKKIVSPTASVAIPLSPNPQIIEFKNISFKYPGSERYILKKFNLIIKSGEKIALVGENGAGKTTLIKLLLRFYDVTEGEILINGINLKEISLAEWHKSIGALFQDFIKYQFTFKENVYFGDIIREQEEKYLKVAILNSGADSYIKDLPNKYDQIVGKMFEGGVDLSGGQWQKLALARAFYRDAPILILDEPTSAIDAKAEYEIFEKVQNLQKDKTVIIISHRFSTVRNADRVLVLDEGKIVEEGSHDILMKRNGLYAELFNIQAQGYK